MELFKTIKMEGVEYPIWKNKIAMLTEVEKLRAQTWVPK